MELYFDEGQVFNYYGEYWEIAHIDYSDDEYPYECYPVQVIQDAKQIIENDDECDYCSYVDVLNDMFVDDRICFSEHSIQQYIYEEEIRVLKARIKELESGLK